jgi:hypothetical protein
LRDGWLVGDTSNPNLKIEPSDLAVNR